MKTSVCTRGVLMFCMQVAFVGLKDSLRVNVDSPDRAWTYPTLTNPDKQFAHQGTFHHVHCMGRPWRLATVLSSRMAMHCLQHGTVHTLQQHCFKVFNSAWAVEGLHKLLCCK